MRESVDTFIKELNSSSPSVTMSRLDINGNSSFSYLGIKFKLEVPDGDTGFTIKTNFDHNKRAAGISIRLVEWNKAFQELGLISKECESWPSFFAFKDYTAAVNWAEKYRTRTAG